MKKTKVYEYKSSSGTVITPINLEIGNPKTYIIIISDTDKILTNGTLRKKSVQVPLIEEEDWVEVELTDQEKEEMYPKDLEEEKETNYKELLDIVTGADDAEQEVV